MELKDSARCIYLLATFFILVVSATDTSDTSRDDVIEQLLLRVDRLEARAEDHEARAEDKQREINDLRVQLVSQKKRTALLENIVRRLKKKERKENVKLNRSDITIPEISDRENQEKTEGKRTAHERIRQTEVDTPVAFFATLTNHQTHVGVHQVIILDHVVTNVGNAYNPHVGTFIAPVPGTYAISVTITTYVHHVAHYYIAVNGNAVSKLYVNGNESYAESSSQTVVLQLSSGDDVTIRSYDSDKSVNGDHYTTLSGFLIYQQGPSAGQIVGK